MVQDHLKVQLETCIKFKNVIIEQFNRDCASFLTANLNSTMSLLVKEVQSLSNILSDTFPKQKEFLDWDIEGIISSAGINPYKIGFLARDLDNLKLVIDDQYGAYRKRLSKGKETCKKIFISHSSNDKSIVDAFVTLLTRGGGLPQDDIFCTSIDGLKITNGEDIRKHIQENVNYADFAILLVSNNYKKSEVCLNEMGAVWAIDKIVKAYVFPDMLEESVGWLINNKAAEKLNDITALASLYEELQKFYNLSSSVHGWTAQAKEFCDRFTDNHNRTQ